MTYTLAVDLTMPMIGVLRRKAEKVILDTALKELRKRVEAEMRIALHTGKGGVGKTTISAATAIACATGGARTLLVSTDPAHSIADVLGVAVHADPTPVAGVPNLWAAQVDTRGRFEQSWSHIRGYLVGVLAARGMAEVQAEELTVLPGAEEIVALLELRRLAESGDFDVDRRRLRADRRDAPAAGAAGDRRLLRAAAARRPAAGAAQHRRLAQRAARRCAERHRPGRARVTCSPN